MRHDDQVALKRPAHGLTRVLANHDEGGRESKRVIDEGGPSMFPVLIATKTIGLRLPCQAIDHPAPHFVVAHRGHALIIRG